MTISRDDITFLVLCGGAGTRMGGVDKPLVIYDGKAMIDNVLASVTGTAAVLISANRNTQAYAQRGHVVGDHRTGLPEASGPLVGVLAGLEACATNWLLVAPGDTPLLPRNWANKMIAASGGVHNVVAHDGDRQQHLHLLLRSDTRASLRAYLEAGNYEVYRWLAEIRTVRAHFANPAAFANINTEADLR